MHHAAIFKIDFLFTIEALAIMAAVFLMLYVRKQAAGKWFRYGSGAITIFVVGVMLCSLFNAFTLGCHSGKCHDGGQCYYQHEKCWGHHDACMGNTCPFDKMGHCKGDMGSCNHSMGNCDHMGSGKCDMGKMKGQCPAMQQKMGAHQQDQKQGTDSKKQMD